MSGIGNGLGAGAAWYARHGFPVFPCQPRAKKPLTPHGFKDATTDQARVAAWWRKWPDANIGMRTGAASGLLVLDVDPRNGGDGSLDELRAMHGLLPGTAEQLTGGGGRHIVFRHPGIRVRTELARGIDLKGDGGYIVVAPSIHPTGNLYHWDGVEGEDALLKPADAPHWLVERVRKVPAAIVSKTSGTREQRPDDGQKWRVGERNNRLASMAGGLRKCGLVPSGIEAALLEQNRLRCHPPLSASEVQKISKSIARYPAGNPTAFVPPGYDSASEALWDVIRFASNIPESRVLMFHVERSLGYSKASDCTSLSQLVGGVFSRTLNEWLRKGCGLGKSAVIRANRALADRELLIVRPRSSRELGNEPTEYEVNWPVLSRYISERKQDPPPTLVPKRDKPLVP